MKKTKIIATLGPACDNVKTLRQMVLNGMNVARINLSHSNKDSLIKLVELVKKVRTEMKTDLAIMVDTKGPEIRTGVFENGKAKLKKGQTFTFFKENIVGDETKCTISQKEIFDDVKIGNKFSACNGLITFKCVDKDDMSLTCKVVSGGEIGDHKSMSFPHIHLSVEYLNDTDKADLIWSIDNEVDYIAASFVSSKEDILKISKLIKDRNSNVKIISKVENKIALDNLDEIVEYSDGVMVARGDLGIEIPLEKVPRYQKKIIQKCNELGKTVIIATEMLESMTKSIRPTRAETSDVANAVYEGASAVMLSGESAIGKYPEEAVSTMAKIAIQTEKSIDYKDCFFNAKYKGTAIQDVMSIACVQASFMIKDVKAIVVYTDSGHTALFISRLHPNVPIIALTPSIQTYYQLALVWNVKPYLVNGIGRADDLIDISNEILINNKIAKPGDVVLFGSGSRKPTKTDMLKVHILE